MATLPPTEAEDAHAARVRACWPGVVAKLGERAAAFDKAVRQRAAGHGLFDGASAARYLNLCLAFGPGFEDKTENEWALAVLADERLRPEVKLHQLVLRGARELERRRGDFEALCKADARVLDALDAERLAADRDATRVPRKACDLEAIEIRVLDNAFRQEYVRNADAWERGPARTVQPLRIDANHPAPAQLTVLTGTTSDAVQARVQLRQVLHGQCALGLHPAARWLGRAGISEWREHQARSVAWPVTALAPASTPRLLAETPPDASILDVPSCGLRDDGVPLGGVRLQLWAYAAHQWLFTMNRHALLGVELPDPKSSPPAVEPTRLRVERDGGKQPVGSWQEGFDVQLPAQLREGLQRLVGAWQGVVQQPQLRAGVTLFDGKAALTWGWREGANGLASQPVQRVVAELDLAAAIELVLSGAVEYAGAKAQIRLRVEGRAQLAAQIERSLAEPPLIEALAGAQTRWRWPVVAEADPLADEGGVVFAEFGPCTGAIVGSLGLRPSMVVGGAWEWFARLALEPVSARVVVHDPLLGRTESRLALLGSMPLLDWSLV